MKKFYSILFFGLFVAVNATAQTWSAGPSAIATLDGTTLTISGTGPMTDFVSDWPSNLPWFDAVNDLPLTLVIEYGITSVGDYAFENCTIVAVTIPNSVLSIGAGAFRNSFLALGWLGYQFIIPSSVNSIGADNAIDVSWLTSFTSLNPIPPDWDEDLSIFGDPTAAATITLRVPATSVNLYRSTFPWSEFNVVPIPTGIPSISFSPQSTKPKTLHILESNGAPLFKQTVNAMDTIQIQLDKRSSTGRYVFLVE